MVAVAHASMILDWMDNAPSGDMPPRWMWPHDKATNQHWMQVRADQEAERSGEGRMERNEMIGRG